LLKKEKFPSLYIDATGSVIRKIPNIGKKPFYYCLSVKGNGKGNPPLPLTQFISCGHAIKHVCPWLIEFFQEFRKYSTKNVFKIEMDFSWVLIHSVLLAVNKESLNDYLTRAYQISTNKNLENEKTVVHLCAAHCIKNVANKASELTKDTGLRELCCYSFARMLNANDLKTIDEIFENLCNLLLSREYGSEQEKSRNFLNLHITSETKHEENEEECNFDSSFYEEDNNEAKKISHMSPFKNHFIRIKNKVDTKILNTSTFKTNPYLLPSFIEYILVHYMPYAPLWTGLLLKPSLQTRDTNSYAEIWFRIVKHQILRGEKNLPAKEFIWTVYKSIKARFKKYQILNNIVLQPQKKDTLLAEEQWQDKVAPIKKKTKYFNIPNVSKITPKKLTTKNKMKLIQKVESKKQEKPSFSLNNTNKAERNAEKFFKTIERQEIELFLKRCKQFDKKEFTMIDRFIKEMERGMFEKVCIFASMPNAYKTILVEDLRTIGYYLNNAIIGNTFIRKKWKKYWIPRRNNTSKHIFRSPVRQKPT